MSALVLVGMSVSDVNRREEILAAARARGATVAFLQMADPSLSHELTRLADKGHREITLVGIDTGLLAPGHSWLRRIAAHWWRERAGDTPAVLVAGSLVKDLDQLDESLGAIAPITGTEPGLTSSAWEDVTAHRHQVLVCRGPRCTARGQDGNLAPLLLAMARHGLGDDDVLITHTGCQFPCNQAPVVVVQPDDVWYGNVTPQVAEAIVGSHLIDGVPVGENRLPRG